MECVNSGGDAKYEIEFLHMTSISEKTAIHLCRTGGSHITLCI
jgi:hypothetical protein